MRCLRHGALPPLPVGHPVVAQRSSRACRHTNAHSNSVQPPPYSTRGRDHASTPVPCVRRTWGPPTHRTSASRPRPLKSPASAGYRTLFVDGSDFATIAGGAAARERGVTDGDAVGSDLLAAGARSSSQTCPTRRSRSAGTACSTGSAAPSVGSEEELTRLLRDELSAPGPGTLVGSGRTASVRDAALINGAAGHTLDFDDTHTLMSGHPTAAGAARRARGRRADRRHGCRRS